MVSARPRGVVVTGGLGDIGLAIARRFAEQGAALLLLDARADTGDASAALHQAGASQVLSCVADVADAPALTAALDTAESAFGAIDVVVNVAGMMIYKGIAELTPDDWRRLLDVNLLGAALLTGEAFRRMRPGGCIVNVASVHARRTSPLVAPYAAAKAGLVSLTRSAAIEGRSLGIRVNAVLPGAVDTAMLRASPNVRSGAETIEPAELGQPDDVAAVVAFLASDEARFVTGEDLVADGGRMGEVVNMHFGDVRGDDEGSPPTAAGASGAVWLAAAVSALGGLLFGYDWVVIGGAKPFYEAAFALDTPWLQAWAVSCALIGCLVGAMLSGVAADRYGRRPALLAAAIIFAISSIGTALAGGFATFVLWRMAGGVAIGMASGLSPLYIAEISPARSRGRLVVLNQIAIVLGLLSAQIVNWLIAAPVPAGADAAAMAASWNGTLGWRWMFAAATVPAVGFVIGCLFIPESPRWLAQHGAWDRARRVLARLGGDAHAEAALAEISRALDAAPGRRLGAILAEPRFRRVLVIGIVLAVLQQWCGINVIFNYAQEIFAGAGYAVSDTLFNIVITGAVNCIFTLVALGTVERWGRRGLLLVGCAGLTVIYAAVGAAYVAGVQGWPLLLLVVAAIAVYAMTLAPVTWVALSEIFPGEARGASMAVATTALWTACFLLTYTFPLLNAAAGTGVTFWIYGAICAAGFVFIHRCLPETKGKTLEQIESEWR